MNDAVDPKRPNGAQVGQVGVFRAPPQVVARLKHVADHRLRLVGREMLALCVERRRTYPGELDGLGSDDPPAVLLTLDDGVDLQGFARRPQRSATAVQLRIDFSPTSGAPRVIIQHEMAGAGAQDSEFYVRYYVGHKGKVGRVPTIPSLLRLLFFSPAK